MEEQQHILLIVSSGILGLFSIIITIVLFTVIYRRKLKEQRMVHIIERKNQELKRLREVIEGQEIEQEKLVINLHDEIGPLMTALKLNITRCYKQLIADGLDPEELLHQRTSIDHIMENVRSVSQNLSPLFLLKYGLAKALKKFMDSIKEVEVSFESTLAEECIVPKHVSIQLYKIVLELLKNIIRHDTPRLIKVFMYLDDKLIIEIAHDGKGISLSEMKQLSLKPSCVGLKSIFSGILILDSKLEIWRDPDLNRIKIST